MKKFFSQWSTLPAPKQAALILIGAGLGFTLYSSIGIVIVQPVLDYVFSRHDPN